MPRILLAHGHDSHAIGAALWRKIKIADLRELFLQQRHKHFIERHAKNRRLIGRSASVSTVVDRVFPGRHGLNGKNGEALHFIVITSVIAEWSFVGHFGRVDVALQNDFTVRRHHQIIGSTGVGDALGQICFLAAQ